MSWSACDRFELTPAPGGLALIQDFLNTRRRLRPVSDDLLERVGTAQEWADAALRTWSERTGRPFRRARLTKTDLVELTRVRDELAAALRRRDHGASSEGRQDTTPAGAFIGAEISLAMRPGGEVVAEPSGTGWTRLVSALLIEAHGAQLTDQWRRLKTCRNPRCPGSFFDKSPNNSGAWHDVTTCGNIANLRAARARKRADRP